MHTHRIDEAVKVEGLNDAFGPELLGRHLRIRQQ